MSPQLELNVWIIDISAPPKIEYFDVDSHISPVDIKAIVEDELGWSRSTFSLLMPSQSMKIPNPMTNEALLGLQKTPPKNLTLQQLPGNWNAEEVFGDKQGLHLVAIKRGAYKVKIFNTQSRKIISSDAYLGHYIDSFCYPAYKPPALIAYYSPDAKKLLASMDLSTLKEIESHTTLLDLYPLGLPSIIHLINAPEEEDMLLPLNAVDKRQEYFKNVLSKEPVLEAKGTLSLVNQELVGRLPGSSNAAPSSLFDETLCQLRYDVHHVHPLADDYAAFYKLRTEMISTYRADYLRQQVLHQVVSDFLPSTPVEPVINGYRSRGALLVRRYQKPPFAYMLFSNKNEVGLATEDPVVEVSRYYVEHSRSVFEGLEHCVLPAILLCQCGPYLSVLVGSTSPVPIVEQIACIALHADTTNLEEAKAGARIIAALRVASHSLEEKYPSLLKDRDRQIEFPFPRSYTDENGKEVNFTYIRAEEDKRIYYADRNDTGERICVKFSLRYSPEAHQAASKTGYAPTLLANKHVGDWNMIVMKDESSHYINLYDLKAEEKEKGISADRIERIQDEVREALRILHGQGYVHGDIRDVNVLVRKTSADAEFPFILLVDWDWAGREGEATYPYTLNPEIRRPDGATAGAKILPSHDITMVDSL